MSLFGGAELYCFFASLCMHLFVRAFSPDPWSCLCAINGLIGCPEFSLILRWSLTGLSYLDLLQTLVSPFALFSKSSMDASCVCFRRQSAWSCVVQFVMSKVEMTMGMGFPTGMWIRWDSHGNGNWWQNWEWEWVGMGNNLYGNGNGHYSRVNQFPSADTVFSLCNSTDLRVLLLMTTLTENNICDFLRKSKIKTYNILNYYFSGFCTIKMHTWYC